MKKTLSFAFVAIALVVGFFVGQNVSHAPSLGAVIEQNTSLGVASLEISGTSVIDSSRGASFTSVSNSGNSSVGGTLAVTGATTLSGAVNVASTASTTLQIGSTASGVGKGCLVLGDSGGTTSTPVYITATGATVSATTTKPAYCR
jgi:predicted ATP-dependent Lon-type protease